MRTLRASLIHLAHDKPELRPHLLPLLKEAAGVIPPPVPVEDFNAVVKAFAAQRGAEVEILENASKRLVRFYITHPKWIVGRRRDNFGLKVNYQWDAQEILFKIHVETLGSLSPEAKRLNLELKGAYTDAPRIFEVFKARLEIRSDSLKRLETGFSL